MSRNKLFDLVEIAIFHKQAKDTREVIRIVTGMDRTLGRLNYYEVDKLVHQVATQYKK